MYANLFLKGQIMTISSFKDHTVSAEPTRC